ncbi:hypothetical protein OIU76_021813 [Salix suchowensis]|nr:hypothetical protein OIU76_021813 [Salix suchowensis]KAJ6373974.1 hypothetical protein OIU78_029633 [Salix suchowensis]
MNVQILSKKLITPSSPTPTHFRNYKVSWLSMFQSLLLYLPNIFYYPSSIGGDNIERSKRLQKSLLETLIIFHPYAGRCIDNNVILDCNDEGVEYVEIQVSGCLSQLLQGGELEKTGREVCEGGREGGREGEDRGGHGRQGWREGGEDKDG